MPHYHVIRYSRPNAANRAPYMSFWVYVDTEKDISIMYAQQSDDPNNPDWEPTAHMHGDFFKRLIEEYINDDMFLEAWDRLRKE
jgi:hypothetical protein